MFTQEDIDRAVQKALEPVLEQFNALKANRDQILAEKRKRIVGKTEGAEFTVATPNGTRNFEILKLVTVHEEA